MTEELKPCPACGHSPAVLLENEEKRYRYSYACGNFQCGFTTLFCSTVERAAMYWNLRPLETVSLSTEEHSYTIVLPKPEEQVVKMVVREVLEEKQKHGMKPFDAARCVCGSIPQGHVAVDGDGYYWYFVMCKECQRATTPEVTVDLAKIQWNNLIYDERDRIQKESKMSSHNRETLLQVGKVRACKECGLPGVLMLYYNDPTGDRNRPADGYYIMHPPNRSCSVWNLHRLQPATWIYPHAGEAVQEWNEKFGQKPEQHSEQYLSKEPKIEDIEMDIINGVGTKPNLRENKHNLPAMSSHDQERLAWANANLKCECSPTATFDKVVYARDQILFRCGSCHLTHGMDRRQQAAFRKRFSPEKPNACCGNCRFGVLCGSRHTDVYRQCKKCSPYVNKDGASKWPRVGDRDWCGDHEYKEDPGKISA